MDIIGIDISKNTLDIFDLKRKSGHKFSHDQDGVDQLVAWLEKSQDDRKPLIVAEATGGFERRLLRFLDGRVEAAIANPARVRSFAKAGGQWAKTDRIDAQIIAAFGAWAKLEPCGLPDADRQTLIELLHYRAAAQDELVRRRQQLSHITDPDLHTRAVQAIDQRAHEIKELSKLIRDKIRTHPALEQRFQILTSMPRIGLIAAANILAHLPEIGTLNRQQIAALAGLAPVANDSGKYMGKRPIRGGRQTVRNALYMAAIGCAQLNNRFGNAFKAMQNHNKPGKVIAVAIMRKMLTTLNAMVKNNQHWQHECTLNSN